MKRKKTEENSLLTALEFVAITQPKRSPNPAYEHCRLFGNQLSACGPVLSASVGIKEEIQCCPDTQKFLHALKQCPETVNLTLLPTKELSIKSGNFHAIIPCIEQVDIPTIFPDSKQLSIEIQFQQALEQVGKLADEHSKLILYSSVVLLNGSVIATNGDVILEAWHGCTSPNPVLLPKLFISALARTKSKPLYLLGWSSDSLTAHFPDGSWLSRPVYRLIQRCPTCKVSLSIPSTGYIPVPLGLWAAVNRLAPFSNDGRIYFKQEGICTDRYQTDGAINLAHNGLPCGISFPIAAFQTIAAFAEHLAFNVTEKITYFQGKNIRGAISQRVEQ